ncbi:MAG: acyltransferase family protein [Kiritimatiellae bacterium]|nr:acyltransferase family protein [Kiritimatiellia bacterium]
MSFICVCLVVELHLCNLPEIAGSGAWIFRVLANAVASAAVPSFFCISGFWLAQSLITTNRGGDWWLEQVAKRAKTLLVPLLLGSFAYSAFLAVILTLGDLAYSRCETGVWACFFEYARVHILCMDAYGVNPFQQPALHPAWYLRTLFLYVAASPLFIIPLRRYGLKALAAIFAAAIALDCALPPYEYGTPLNQFWIYLISPQGIAFFASGIYLAFHGTRPCGSLRFACIAAAVAIPVARLFCALHGIHIPSVFAVPMLAAVAAGVWFATPSAKWPKWMTSATFGIYLLHLFWPSTMNSDAWLALMQRLVSGPARESLAIYLLNWAGAVAFALCATLLLRRFAPRTAALLFGGR